VAATAQRRERALRWKAGKGFTLVAFVSAKLKDHPNFADE
jgi:hypothetical protein